MALNRQTAQGSSWHKRLCAAVISRTKDCIFSSGNKNVLLAEKLQREFSGTDQIVQEYLKRA